MFSQICCLFFSSLQMPKKRILWLCPRRFRFRTSPYYLIVVLLPSWAKNKCRALPLCGFATVCHQVRCMYWGHLSNFHKGMSLLTLWPFLSLILWHYPYSKVHGANMGPIWGRQDPGGPHVGPMNLAIRVYMSYISLAHHTAQMNPVVFIFHKANASPASWVANVFPEERSHSSLFTRVISNFRQSLF